MLDKELMIGVVTMVVMIVRTCHAAGQEDFCEREHFTPQCPDNHVILMAHAQYGRMEEGRCITRNHGFMNCAVNVLGLLHRRCSGRPTCDVAVAGLVPEQQQPCPRDFRSYLTANYSCIPVAVAKETHTCPGGSALLPVVKTQHGYLSSYITTHQSIGTVDCPWLIRASPGQRLKVSLLDFSAPLTSTTVCHVYAIVKDLSNRHSNTVCGGNRQFEDILTSESHEVEIRIISKSGQEETGEFLLKYETLGCPTVEAPPHVIVQQTHDLVKFKCRDTGEQWYQNCKHNVWVGTENNCSYFAVMGAEESQEGWPDSLPYGFSVLVIVCIAICIAVAVLVVGLVCIHKRRLRTRAEYMHKLNTGHPPVYDDNYHRQNATIGQKIPTHGGGPIDGYPHPANEYHPSYDMHRGVGRPTPGCGMQLPLPAVPPGGPMPGGYNQNYGDNERYLEHVYESPKFEHGDENDLPYPHNPSRGGDISSDLTQSNKPHVQQYYELDPEVIPHDAMSQQIP